MDRFFSIFGKIILGTLLLSLILGAGYYIGHSKIIQPSLKETPSPAVSEKQTIPTTAPSLPAGTKPTSVPAKKTLTGGLSDATAFSNYSVDVPLGWSDKKDITPGVIDKLTLSKGAYSLSIYQAAMGGGMCLYPEDTPFDGPSQKFTHYVDLLNTPLLFRRSWNDDAKNGIQSYVICQKTSDAYGSPTTFGAISYQTPEQPDDTILEEMDTILASLKK